MALAHLDHLQPAEQMLVKCAAIIGHTFTTQMLADVLPEATGQKLNASLASLFKSGTFECGSKQPKTFDKQAAKDSERCSALSCFCAARDSREDLRKGQRGSAREKASEWRRECVVELFVLVPDATDSSAGLTREQAVLYVFELSFSTPSLYQTHSSHNRTQCFPNISSEYASLR